MLSLLFIFCVTAFSILISCQLASEINWFTYYLGVVFGLFISGLILEIRNKRRERKLQALESVYNTLPF